MTLLASHQHPDQEAEAESDADGFVWMLADAVVGSFRRSDRFFFQPMACAFGGLERCAQAAAQFSELFPGLPGRGCFSLPWASPRWSFPSR